jgi:hypothetical protein
MPRRARPAHVGSGGDPHVDERVGQPFGLGRQLAEMGRLRPGLRVAEVADVIWATNSAELFVLLTLERGWSAQLFEEWLTDTQQRLLLD